MGSEDLLELECTVTPRGRDVRPLDPPGRGRLLAFIAEVHQEWRTQAACQTVDPRWFFIERGEEYIIARRTCASCPVIAECREYVMTLPAATPGYWAGMSQRDRDRIRRRKAA